MHLSSMGRQPVEQPLPYADLDGHRFLLIRNTGIPSSILDLMKLYPQPVRQSSNFSPVSRVDDLDQALDAGAAI